MRERAGGGAANAATSTRDHGVLTCKARHSIPSPKRGKYFKFKVFSVQAAGGLSPRYFKLKVFSHREYKVFPIGSARRAEQFS
jgi:hypothetical protein